MGSTLPEIRLMLLKMAVTSTTTPARISFQLADVEIGDKRWDDGGFDGLGKEAVAKSFGNWLELARDGKL